MKLKYSFLALAGILLAMTQVSYADTLSFVPGTTLAANPGLTGFATNGDQMVGILVTAIFGGSSPTTPWAATGAGSGGVNLPGVFSLNLSGDSFSSNWTLQNLSQNALLGLTIAGPPGKTVFDICLLPPCNTDSSFGTDGSARGWTFDRNGGTYVGNIDVTYRDRVAIIGNPPVGDLWGTLDLRFSQGIAQNQTLTWIADTDSVPAQGQIVVVAPETSSLTLLGITFLTSLLYWKWRNLTRRNQPELPVHL